MTLKPLSREMALKRIRKRLRAEHLMLRECHNGAYMILCTHNKSVVWMGLTLEDLVEKFHIVGTFETLEENR